MIRTRILALVILAVAALPVQAHGGGHGGHGGGHGSHGHRGHHHHHFHGGAFYALYPYGYPNCWDEGHWVNQLYMDRYGGYTYVPQWVPGQWMCWY